jgi:hypothetical protein
MNSIIRFIFSIIGLMAFKIAVINSQIHITINGNVLIHELTNTQFDGSSKNSMFLDMIMGLSTTVNMTQVTKSNRTITRNNLNITELVVIIDADVEISEVEFEDDQDSSSSSSSSSSSESHEHHYKTTIKTTTISTLWYCKIHSNDLLNCSTSNGSVVIKLPSNSSNIIISNNQTYNIFDCYYTNISMLNCTFVPTSNGTAATTSSMNNGGSTTSSKNFTASNNYNATSSTVSPLINIQLNCSLIYSSVLVCNPSLSVIVTTSQAPSTTTTPPGVIYSSSVISNNFTTDGPTTAEPTTVEPTTQNSTNQADSTASQQNSSTVVAASTPYTSSSTIQTTTSCHIFDGVSGVYGSNPVGSKPYTILISEVKQFILFSGSMVYSLASISKSNNVNIYGDIRNATGNLGDADIYRLSNSIITGVRIFSKDVIYGLQFQLYDNETKSLSWKSLAGKHDGKYSVLDANSISSVVEIFEITSITLYIDSSLVVLPVPFISGIKFEYSYSSCELYSIPTIPTTTFFVTTTFKPPTTIKTFSTTICPIYSGKTNQYGYVGFIGKTFSIQTDTLRQIIFFADNSSVLAIQFIFLNYSSVFYGDEADSYYAQDSIQIIQLGIGVKITAINIKSSRYINSIQVQTYNTQTNTYLWSPVSKKF